MNPQHNSNQNPATTSPFQQVNSIIYQQTYDGNVGGLYHNNRPIAAPSRFTNFSNHPFPLQHSTGQFPNVIGGFKSSINIRILIPFL
ncbi:hypothetical protein L1887_35622 [Cichorium endivia]|nr:hypothetical protein L1887_35622 [Cichorium endivia]